MRDLHERVHSLTRWDGWPASAGAAWGCLVAFKPWRAAAREGHPDCNEEHLSAEAAAGQAARMQKATEGDLEVQHREKLPTDLASAVHMADLRGRWL